MAKDITGVFSVNMAKSAAFVALGFWVYYKILKSYVDKII